MSPLRCGDHVLHRPSGETWVVAWADHQYVAPAGWPDSLGKRADCELTRACTDEEHAAAVDGWMEVLDHNPFDARANAVGRAAGRFAP